MIADFHEQYSSNKTWPRQSFGFRKFRRNIKKSFDLNEDFFWTQLLTAPGLTTKTNSNFIQGWLDNKSLALKVGLEDCCCCCYCCCCFVVIVIADVFVVVDIIVVVVVVDLREIFKKSPKSWSPNDNKFLFQNFDYNPERKSAKAKIITYVSFVTFH